MKEHFEIKKISTELYPEIFLVSLTGLAEKPLKYVNGFLKEMGLSEQEAEYSPLPADGSNRYFWRIRPSSSETSFVFMENPPKDEFSRRENRAYFSIGKHLFQKALPVPEIHRVELQKGWFILQDMGSGSLQESVGLLENRVETYKSVAEILFHLQIRGAKGFDKRWTCQTETYDRTVMRRYESDYFRNAYLCDYLKLDRDLSRLDNVFDYMAETAGKAQGGFFLHRDFQSRNILVSEGSIGIIDWQGGRLGPLEYDLASLLIDPYVALTREEQEQVFQHYLLLLGEYRSEYVGPFRKVFPYIALQRNLQILGAFAFLTRVRKKFHFERHIQPALQSLHQLLLDLEDPKLSPLLEIVRDLPVH